MSTWAVIVAAGRGDRFGGAKQFAPLGGRRVVDWAVRAAAEACDGVVVVVPPDSDDKVDDATTTVAGGETRSASVRAGLAVVPQDAEIIVVHDAARPLAPRALFDAVIAAVRGGADGAVPALPVADTIKEVEGSRVVRTVDRARLVAVQTPQAFRAAALRAAHDASNDATDDAGLVEAAGGAVVVVPGDARAMKVTDAADLVIASALVDG